MEKLVICGDLGFSTMKFQASYIFCSKKLIDPLDRKAVFIPIHEGVPVLVGQRLLQESVNHHSSRICGIDVINPGKSKLDWSTLITLDRHFTDTGVYLDRDHDSIVQIGRTNVSLIIHVLMAND